MNLEMDAYVKLGSPLHQWSSRAKLLGLGALIFGFSTVKSLWLVPWMLGITIVLYGVSRLPVSFLRSRLRYPGLFLLGVVVALPLMSGETVLWQWGALSLRQEGLLLMVIVASRFLSIITVGVILLGTTPFLELIGALRALGLPSLLTDMALLSYRYLFDITDHLSQLRQAMRLRGFSRSHHHLRTPGSFTWRTWQQLATVAGTLLIRSYEQSERVYRAMRLRGYGLNPRSPQTQVQEQWTDVAGLVACITISIVFVMVPWFLL